MPYYKIEEKQVDNTGMPINPGDILEGEDFGATRYYACYTDDGKQVQVRDLSANNVCMCDLGLKGDVRNLGHYSNHLDKLEEDDLTYYFATDWNNYNEAGEDANGNYCKYGSTKKKFLLNGGKL